MAIFTLSGYDILYDIGSDDPVGVGPATLAVALSGATTPLRYEVTAPGASPEDVPLVEFVGFDPYATVLNAAPLPQATEIGVGRMTRLDGVVHDLLILRIEPPAESGVGPSDHVFLLGGAALPAITSTADLAVFDGATFAPIPAGAPFAPDTDFTLQAVPGVALDTNPQIIRAGAVVEDLDSEWPEVKIGVGEFSAPTVTTGSVTVLGGAQYILVPTGGAYLNAFVGGWNGEGAITVAGAGSRAEFQAAAFENAEVWVNFGVDMAVSTLRVEDGGTFALVNPHSHADNRTSAYLNIGQMFGTANATIDGGSVLIDGFNHAELMIGGDTAEAELSLRNSSLLTIAPEASSSILIGQFGGQGRLVVEGGSQALLGRLEELTLGQGASWDPALTTRGELVVRGAGSRVTLVTDGDPADADRITVGGEGATGWLHVTDGGRFEVSHPPAGGGTMPWVFLDLGFKGNGQVMIDAGGVMDLGGTGRIQVGVLLNDPTSDIFPQGRLTVTGEGSELTGITILSVGHDPADLDPLITPRGFGTLMISDGGAVGNAGATIALGQLGTMQVVGAASVTGDIVMRGASLSMWETSRDRLDVAGDLTIAEGQNTIFLAVRPEGADLIQIDGDFRLDGGAVSVIVSHPMVEHTFVQGETHALIQWDGVLVDGDAAFDAFVGHSFLFPDFAYAFDVNRLDAGEVRFTALNNEDGSGVATLDFTGGASALVLEYNAPSASGPGDPGRFDWQGGGDHGGLAVNVDVIRGTGLDDGIDLRGLAHGLEVHGGAGADLIVGGQGGDTLMGGLGDDMIDGTSGSGNIAVYTGNFADYDIAIDEGTRSATIADLRAGGVNEGTDTLRNIQTLRFADGDRPLELPELTLGLDVVPMGDKQMVDSAPTSSGVITPFAVALANGTYAVLHKGPGDLALYGRIMGPDGTPLGDAFNISQGTQNNQRPFAASHADGTFTVVWQANDSSFPGTPGIYSERFAADGTPLAGTRTLVNPVVEGDQVDPVIAVSVTSGYTLTAWFEAGGGITDQGVAWKLGALPPTLLPAQEGTTFEGLAIAPLPGGDFLLAWGKGGGTVTGLPDGAPISDRDIIGQRVGMDGTPQGGMFRINSDPVGQQNDPFLTLLADGTVLVTWQDRDPVTDAHRLMGQKVTADGTLQGDVMELSDRAISPFVSDTSEAVAALEDGGFVVVFQTNDNVTSRQIMGRRFDADGTPFGDAFVVEQNPPAEDLGRLHVTGLEGGGFAVAWVDLEGGVWTTQTRAYAPQFVGGDGAEVLAAPSGQATQLFGLAGDDTLQGGAGDDTLAGGTGNDAIDGGAGGNTARYAGNRADYTIATNQETRVTTVTDNRAGGANEGTDTVTNVATLQFADIGYTVDLPPLSGPALTITALGQEGATITYGVSVDAGLVAGGTLEALAFTLGLPGDLAFVPGSATGGFAGHGLGGEVVFSATGLGLTDLSGPVFTFQAALSAAPGARDVTLAVDGVTMNDIAMDDQSFDFSHDAAFFNLSGVVAIREAAAGAVDPAGTEVTFAATGGGSQSVATDADGTYSFLLEAGTAGTLDLVRAYDPAPGGPDKALTINDVLDLFRVVAGVPTLSVAGDDLVAGDVNRSGSTDINDVLSLFRHVAGVPGEPAPQYVFIDDGADLSGVTPSTVPLPVAGFDVAAIAADTDLSFLGILGGDLNGHV